MTRILDNVQLTIQNIHVRLESFEHFNSKFSMGFTLKEIAVHTTNAQWDKEFFNRTKGELATVFKVLSIVKFGVYWITSSDDD